jgi:hypothetical protein
MLNVDQNRKREFNRSLNVVNVRPCSWRAKVFHHFHKQYALSRRHTEHRNHEPAATANSRRLSEDYSSTSMLAQAKPVWFCFSHTVGAIAARGTATWQIKCLLVG